MKYAILLTIIAAMTLSSCRDEDCIYGAGSKKEVRRIVGEGKDVDMELSGHIVVRNGVSDTVSLYGYSNILDKIDVYLSNETIFFRKTGDEKFCSGSDVEALVYLPKIRRIIHAGSGDIVGHSSEENPVYGDDVTLRMIGSGDIDFENLLCESVDLTIEGSGYAYLSRYSGTTSLSRIDIEGSGSINAINFLSKKVVANIYGSGNIYVFALDTLIARIYGSGNIYYRDEPDFLDAEILGTGKIEKYQ